MTKSWFLRQTGRQAGPARKREAERQRKGGWLFVELHNSLPATHCSSVVARLLIVAFLTSRAISALTVKADQADKPLLQWNK